MDDQRKDALTELYGRGAHLFGFDLIRHPDDKKEYKLPDRVEQGAADPRNRSSPSNIKG